MQMDPAQIQSLEQQVEILVRGGRAAEAITLLQRVVDDPAIGPRLLTILAALLRATGRLPEARTMIAKGMARHPDFGQLRLEVALLAEAHVRLGNTLGEQARFDEAIACYEQALALAPDNVERRHDLAGCLLRLGRVTDCVSLLRQTLERAPQAQAARSLLLFALNLCTLSQEELTREHERSAATLGIPQAPPTPRVAANATRSSRDRLRVGFVSADLRRHSVSYFLEPIIEHLDRKQFDVACYATGGVPDEVTARLRSYAQLWVDCHGLDDEGLAQRIRRDDVDVLIDLAGHAVGGRPLLFAQRIAPVQVSFLGYPTITGLPSMDFRISDRFVDSDNGALESAAGREQTLRMPDSYFCYRPPSDAPPVAALPWLHRGTPTFGSFNTLAKIVEPTLAAWAQALRAVPTARLLLKAQGLTGPQARSRLLARCAAAGIDPQRVEVLDFRPDPRSHLECYSHVDIALDTYPYNGATTTCEALWMGVPVVSLSGNTHVSRMGHSILSAAGRPEWVATDTAGFAAKCVALVSDAQRLAAERASLRALLMRSPLMNEHRYVRAFEQLLIEATRLRQTAWSAEPPPDGLTGVPCL